jgi:hypothetical protein
LVTFPEMVRTASWLGEARYALGDRRVDRYPDDGGVIRLAV